MKKIFIFVFLLSLFVLTGCEGEKECIHEYEIKEVVDVTCTTDGYTIYECILCEDSYKGSIVRSKGHQTYVSTKGTKATCEEPGYTDELSCQVCNQVVKKQEKISILGHSYGNWEEETAPTKTSEGLLVKKCKNDSNHFDSYVLPKLNPIDYKASITEATCSRTGLEIYSIEVYGKTYTYEIVIDKLDHTYNAVVTAPTCEKDGYTTYTCSCGDSYVDDYVDKLGHDYKEVVTAPTCEKEGYTTYTCSCGDSYVDDYIDALGHNLGDYIYNNDATCDEDGTETSTCINGCGKTDVRKKEGSKLGHDYIEEVVLPTCEAAGYTNYTCKNDSSHTYKDNFVDALGHSYNEYIYNNDATCDVDGTETSTCINGCGKTDVRKKEGSKLGHDYLEEVVSPTCNSEGYTIFTCKNDSSHSYKDNYVDKLEHIFTNYISDNNATCETDGTKTATCDLGCGKIDTMIDEGSKTGHSFISSVIAPTCEGQGYSMIICQYCEKSTIDTNSYVPALGHKFVDYEYNGDATCTTNGTKSCYCSNGCGKLDTIIYEGSAFGHDYVSVVKAPTCLEGGYTTHTCQNDINHSYSDAFTEPLGHNFAEYKTTSPATCLTSEVKQSQCHNNCGEIDTIIVGEPLGHDYAAWYVVITPTAENVGSIKHICNRDSSHYETFDLPRLNPLDYDRTGNDATCTLNGKFTYSYNKDGQILTFDEFKYATGHTIIDIIMNPTCLEDGYTKHECHCGYSYNDTYVDALGHDTYVSIEAYESTCIFTGLSQEISCYRCGNVIIEANSLSALGHKDTDGDTYCNRCDVPVGADVIKISTLADLLAVENDMSAKYQLINDISVVNHEWKGLGNENNPFTGYFNGNGYTIYGIKSTGLFHTNSGVIDSVILADVTIEQSNTINVSTINQTGVNGSFTHSYTQGILTNVNNGTLKNCKIDGENLLT